MKTNERFFVGDDTFEIEVSSMEEAEKMLKVLDPDIFYRFYEYTECLDEVMEKFEVYHIRRTWDIED